jgi:hypothetical protein
VRNWLIEGVLNYLIGTHPTLRDSVIVSIWTSRPAGLSVSVPVRLLLPPY